jgi:hypothetical protein
LLGDGGRIPEHWAFYDVCKAWSCKPSEARKESAFDYAETAKKILSERIADNERESRRIEAENERMAAMLGLKKR